MGADDKLQSAINYWYKREHLLATPAATPCQNGFINISTEYFRAFEYGNPAWDGIDPQRQWLLWNKDAPDLSDYENDCIGFQNMRWYYSNLDGIISDLTPTGKNFSDITIETGFISSNQWPYAWGAHFRIWVNYGTPVWIAGDCPLNPYEMATLDPEKDYLTP